MATKSESASTPSRDKPVEELSRGERKSIEERVAAEARAGIAPKTATEKQIYQSQQAEAAKQELISSNKPISSRVIEDEKTGQKTEIISSGKDVFISSGGVTKQYLASQPLKSAAEVGGVSGIKSYEQQLFEKSAALGSMPQKTVASPKSYLGSMNPESPYTPRLIAGSILAQNAANAPQAPKKEPKETAGTYSKADTSFFTKGYQVLENANNRVSQFIKQYPAVTSSVDQLGELSRVQSEAGTRSFQEAKAEKDIFKKVGLGYVGLQQKIASFVSGVGKGAAEQAINYPVTVGAEYAGGRLIGAAAGVVAPVLEVIPGIRKGAKVVTVVGTGALAGIAGFEIGKAGLKGGVPAAGEKTGEIALDLAAFTLGAEAGVKDAEKIRKAARSGIEFVKNKVAPVGVPVEVQGYDIGDLRAPTAYERRTSLQFSSLTDAQKAKISGKNIEFPEFIQETVYTARQPSIAESGATGGFNFGSPDISPTGTRTELTFAKTQNPKFTGVLSDGKYTYVRRNFAKEAVQSASRKVTDKILQAFLNKKQIFLAGSDVIGRPSYPAAPAIEPLTPSGFGIAGSEFASGLSASAIRSTGAIESLAKVATGLGYLSTLKSESVSASVPAYTTLSFPATTEEVLAPIKSASVVGIESSSTPVSAVLSNVVADYDVSSNFLAAISPATISATEAAAISSPPNRPPSAIEPTKPTAFPETLAGFRTPGRVKTPSGRSARTFTVNNKIIDISVNIKKNLKAISGAPSNRRYSQPQRVGRAFVPRMTPQASNNALAKMLGAPQKKRIKKLSKGWL